MLMVPDTFVFLPRPWKYKCRQTHRGPQGDFCLWGREQLVVLGSGEFLNPWKFPPAPGLDGCSRLMGPFHPVKPRGQHGYSLEVTSTETTAFC